MKLDERMRYPHPVLSEFTSDYVSGDFTCNFVQEFTTGGELKVTSELVLGSKELRDLIEGQQAAVGYYLVCRRTYFNFLQEVPLGRSEKFFDASQLFGPVLIRPVVWTLVEIKNFTNSLVSKEFGNQVRLPKASIIALGPEFRFSMDKQKFKPFESIFELAQNESVAPGSFAVDAFQDRIVISAEPKTYKDLAGMRNMSAGKNILLTSVYLPAVMEVLALLQAGENVLASKNWYRVFKAKCDDLGVDPASKGQSPLILAQKLLKAPLRKAITVAGTF